MKQRLFVIKKPNGSYIPDQFYTGKTAAKNARDELNRAEPGHIVTYGPDHRRVQPH